MKNILNIIFIFLIAGLFFVVITKSGKEYQYNLIVDSLRQENIILDSENYQKDKLITRAEDRISYFELKEQTLERDKEILNSRIASLQAQISTISSQARDLSTDSVYSLLDEIYPTSEEKIYPFSPSQVKSIYITKIERDTLFEITSRFELLVANQECLLTVKDSIISQKDIQIVLYQDKVNIKDSIIFNKDEIINSLEKNIKRQRIQKICWKIGTVGAILAISIIAL